MKTKIFFTSLLMAVFFLASLSYSGVKNVGWQGRVIDSGTGHPLHGNYNIIYSIYQAASGGSPLWTETQSTFIDSGIANVFLGSVTPIPDSVFNGSVRFLGVKVGSDPEMGPRSEMVSVPYASYAFAGGGWKHDGTAVTLATGTDNVGIGTNSPTAKLHVEGDAYISDKLTVGSPIHIGNIGNPGNFDAVSICGPGTYDELTPEAKLEIVAESPRDFLMLSSARDANGDKLIVKNNGKVGIGTISPASRLHVMDDIRIESTTGGPLLFMNGATGGVSAIDFYEGGSGPMANITYHPSYSALMLGHGVSSSDLVIKYAGPTTGNVGIGTTDPQANLHINGTTYFGGVAKIGTGQRIQSESAGGMRILGEQGNTPATPAIGFFSTNGIDDGGGGNGIYRPSANAMAFATVSQERMRISSVGYVGIGTTNPQRPLHISDVMRLEPRSTFPSSPSDGDICVVGSSGSRHIYCYLNGGWRQLD